jgi:transcription-repair coupling factor (superfamily II helicase)
MNQRLMVYRRIASARTEDEIDRIVAEVRDRYGPIPPSILNLADYGRIRVMADRLGVEAVDREGERVVFRFRPQTSLDPATLVGLVARRGDLTLVPPAGLRFDLRPAPPKKQPEARSPRPEAAPQRSGPWANIGRKPLTSSEIRAGRRRPEESAAPASWWTARATSGDVTSGFTKAEILKAGPEDPRGPAGVFTRVGGLLSDLLG